MTKSTFKTDHDVIIVGGGLAGLTLTVLLGRAGIRVGVVEKTPLDIQGTRNFDVRTTAISAGSAAILTRAGIWQPMTDKACPITKIEILDGPHPFGTWPVLLNFDTEKTDGPFGYIVDNLDLRRVQAEAVQNTKNIQMITPASVSSITPFDTHTEITLDQGDVLTASLIIGADGRGSIVRDLARIRTRGWPYGHTAIVSTITHTGSHDHIAIEHFLSDGPFAVLPFTNDPQGRPRSAIVWSGSPKTARDVMGMNDQAFARALAARLPDRYGDVIHVGPRGAYPLTLQHALDYTAPRTALVADAAHGMHPIAGQGLNLGLRDVDTLADLLIAEHQKQHPDYGGAALLNTYARARKPDILALMSGTDTLTGLFGSRLPFVRPLRKIGMRMVEHLPPMKNFFIKAAKGE